jgi:hypothetical protein
MLNYSPKLEYIMSIKTKRNLLSFVLLPIGFLGLGVLGGYHWIFIFLAPLYGVIILYIISSFRCPNCQYPIGMRKYKKDGKTFDLRSHSLLTKSHCDNCGYKF